MPTTVPFIPLRAFMKAHEMRNWPPMRLVRVWLAANQELGANMATLAAMNTDQFKSKQNLGAKASRARLRPEFAEALGEAIGADIGRHFVRDIGDSNETDD